MKRPLVIPIFIPHLGCPHDCLFCNQQKISGSRRDNAQYPEIGKTIEEWLQHKGERDSVQVAFYGGSFTCIDRPLQEKMLEAVQPYIKRGEVDSIRCSTRPDCIDEASCQLLKRYGVTTVELGVQSFDDRVLQKARRGHSGLDAEKAFVLLQGSGLEVGVQLMPGLPGDTTGTFVKTIQKTVELGPAMVRLYPCVVVEQSALENLYHGGGFVPLSLKKSIAVCSYTCKKLQRAGIEVIRMGLQPSDSLATSVVAGPYHPAFGELVQSRIWLQRLRASLVRLREGEKLEIHVSHRDMSAIVGQKKNNVLRLEELGYKDRFSFIANKNMERGSVKYVVCK